MYQTSCTVFGSQPHRTPLWDELERKIRKHTITSKQSVMKACLQEEWQTIYPDTTTTKNC